jgi:hypothetical protein
MHPAQRMQWILRAGTIARHAHWCCGCDVCQRRVRVARVLQFYQAQEKVEDQQLYLFSSVLKTEVRPPLGSRRSAGYTSTPPWSKHPGVPQSGRSACALRTFSAQYALSGASAQQRHALRADSSASRLGRPRPSVIAG